LGGVYPSGENKIDPNFCPLNPKGTDVARESMRMVRSEKSVLSRRGGGAPYYMEAQENRQRIWQVMGKVSEGEDMDGKTKKLGGKARISSPKRRKKEKRVLANEGLAGDGGAIVRNQKT